MKHLLHSLKKSGARSAGILMAAGLVFLYPAGAVLAQEDVSQQQQGDFTADVTQGKQTVANDSQAQINQLRVVNSEDQGAGDSAKPDINEFISPQEAQAAEQSGTVESDNATIQTSEVVEIQDANNLSDQTGQIMEQQEQQTQQEQDQQQQEQQQAQQEQDQQTTQQDYPAPDSSETQTPQSDVTAPTPQ